MIPIIDWQAAPQAVKERLTGRSQLNFDAVRGVVNEVLSNIRQRGDEALLEYTAKFDGVQFPDGAAMRITQEEIDQAYAQVDADMLRRLRAARDNIRAFHEKQMQKTWMDIGPGKTLGQLVRPIASVGVYVPGGTAAYPSSVLMNIMPAKVAGVERIVMVTPPGKDGKANPLSVVCAAEAGANEMIKMGGAQAVAALAFGTESIQKVDKITGPGNIYVANAKREVYGYVGIDMIAGPSEVMVIADASATPRYVAADLLSQAEHDALSAVILATDSMEIAQGVAKELEHQLSTLSRKEIAGKSLSTYGTIVVVPDLKAAAALANEVAPEHLELCVSAPFELLGQIRNAGAIFLGHYTPEPVGDYWAGPNHVLPTSGTARFFSPLSVEDFLKKSSVLYYSREELASCWQDISQFARGEGLDAHARAVELRFEEEK